MSANTKTIDMCSESTWTGSMAYIWSPGFPGYTDVPNCVCSIRLHRPVELQITVPYFKPSPSSWTAMPNKDYCAQSLTFWNDTVLNRVCASHPDTLEVVDVKQSAHVYVQYESIPLLQSSFIITVQGERTSRTFTNIAPMDITKLQHAARGLARVVTRSPCFTHLMPFIKSLFWLPVWYQTIP